MRVELWQQIHAVYGELASIRAVARRLGIHRKTVREALRADRPPRRTCPGRGSIIDPYRGWILAKLEQYPELTAARLFGMLREQKYSGGYGIGQDAQELLPRSPRSNDRYQRAHGAQLPRQLEASAAVPCS